MDVPLRALIEASPLLVDSVAREALIRIDWTPRGRPGTFGRNQTQIRQALLNLLTNAVKYNRPGGVVRAHLLKGEGQWGVAAEGQGEGRSLSGDYLVALFVTFDRMGRGHCNIKGSGIVLANYGEARRQQGRQHRSAQRARARHLLHGLAGPERPGAPPPTALV